MLSDDAIIIVHARIKLSPLLPLQTTVEGSPTLSKCKNVVLSSYKYG